MRTLLAKLQSLLEHGHAFNLDVKAQKLRADGRARRLRLPKVAQIDFVHLPEAFGGQSRQIDSATDDIIKRCTSRGENAFYILQNQLRLLRDAAGFNLAGGGIVGRHPGNKEESSAGGDSQRIWPQSGRGTRKGGERTLHDLLVSSPFKSATSRLPRARHSPGRSAPISRSPIRVRMSRFTS
jgi:hypothetical protein